MDSVLTAYKPRPKQIYIAREGHPFIAIALAGAALLFVLGLHWAALFALGVAGFIAFFFRNPDREIPEGEGLIVAPADGRVISVNRNCKAPHSGNEMTRVSIFMSVLNVHINRFPVSAVVKDLAYHAGNFLVASLDKASEKNERNVLVLLGVDGRDYEMVQIAGLIARRIVCYLKTGDRLDRGRRFGLIRFGSRVDLYLPSEAGVEVQVGDCVSAGSSIIGRYS